MTSGPDLRICDQACGTGGFFSRRTTTASLGYLEPADYEQNYKAGRLTDTAA